MISPPVKCLLWIFLLLGIGSTSAVVLPPTNLTLRWVSDFKTELSWESPSQFSTDCYFNLAVQNRDPQSEESTEQHKEHQITYKMIMEGGFLLWSVTTVCNGQESEAAELSVSYPELVRGFECWGHTSTLTKCSWFPAQEPPDLAFYWTVDDEADSPVLHKCSSYTELDGARTGCDLQMPYPDHLSILFNGTLDNSAVRNTFYRHPLESVKPPPLTYTTVKEGNMLNISWTFPDILKHGWTFTINYSECGVNKRIEAYEQTSQVLNLNPTCAYCVTVGAKHSLGSTPPSEEECFDAEDDGKVILFALITLPLLTASAAALALTCCRKNWDRIFPKVPQPRDLITDTWSGYNKSTFTNFYIPPEREANCEVILLSAS